MGGRPGVSCWFWLASFSFFCVACISFFLCPVGCSSLSTQKCPVFRLTGTLVARRYIHPPLHLYTLSAPSLLARLGVDHSPVKSHVEGSLSVHGEIEEPQRQPAVSPHPYLRRPSREVRARTTVVVATSSGRVLEVAPPPWDGHDAGSPITGRHLLSSQFSLLKLSFSIVMGQNCAGFDVGRQEGWCLGAWFEGIMCHFSLVLALKSMVMI